MAKPRKPQAYTPIYESAQPPWVEMPLLRDALLERDGITHYATLGYFLQWFAAVEMWLDLYLAWALEVGEGALMEVILRGLAPRNKVERLRALCRTKGVTFGPNLTARLSHFEGRVCRLRNNLAHHFLIHTPESEDIVFKQPAPFGKPDREPPRMAIRSLEVFEHGAWLHLFQDDLSSVFVNAGDEMRSLRTLEIAAPRSGLPKAPSPGSRSKASAANGGKQPQRRAPKKRTPKKAAPKKRPLKG